MKRPRESELKFPYVVPPHMIGIRIMVTEVDPWKMSVADTLRRDLRRLKERGARRWLGCLFAAWKLQLAYFAHNSLQFARLLACGASCSKNRLLLWEVWAAWKTSSRDPPLVIMFHVRVSLDLACVFCAGLAVSLVLHNATGTAGVAENWVELIERR
jgi:hypothetical protein